MEFKFWNLIAHTYDNLQLQKGFYDNYYFKLKLNHGCVKEYIQIVWTQTTLYLFDFKRVCKPGIV